MSDLITFNGNHYRRDTAGWYRVYDERAVPIHHVGTWALDEIERLTTENRTHVATIGCLIEQAKSAGVVYQAEIERLGRCNEQLSRSHAEVRNILEGQIIELQAIVAHCRRYAPSVVAAAEGAPMQQVYIRQRKWDEIKASDQPAYGKPPLQDAMGELARLRAFRDAVYGSIVENAGAQEAFAYIWQSRWDEIKAAERGQV